MMNDTQPTSGAQDQERFLAALAYGLYLIGVAGGVSILVGFVIAMVRKSRAQGTIYESHYRNLIQVFFVVLAFAGLMIAAALAASLNLLIGFAGLAAPFWQWPMMVTLIPAAALCSLLLGIWYFWRVLRGFIRVLDEKPY
jgi:uncharacterized membrane protein